MIRPRKTGKPIEHPHGWRRAEDAPSPVAEIASPPQEAVRRGTSLLLALVIAVLTAMGIARVRASTEILEIGAEITELTSEHARLLEQQRRLAAERAYLRHPERIQEFARDKLGMVPIAPELVQQIRLVEGNKTP